MNEILSTFLYFVVYFIQRKKNQEASIFLFNFVLFIYDYISFVISTHVSSLYVHFTFYFSQTRA